MDKKLKLIGFLWCLFVVPVTLIGYFNDNLGAYSFFKVELFYPLLLFFCIVTIKNKKIMPYTSKAIVASSIFISFYTLSLLLYNLGKWPFDFFWIIDDTSAVGMHVGYTHITNTNLSMMIFIFPFLTLLSKQERKMSNLGFKLYFFTLLFAAIAMFLSGRRILWIIAFLSFVFAFFKSELKMSSKIKIFVIVIVFIIFFLTIFGEKLDINLNGLWERFINVFSKKDEYGDDNVRFIQMHKLIDGFIESPFIGKGAGATIEGYYRSKESPWIFEASYHMILFNSGIIFMTFYVLVLIEILYFVYKKHKNYYYSFPIFVSLFMAIFANATNPYFSASFDFLFFIFIPVLYINAKCLYKKKI